jgi:hypothetical protein
MPTTNALLPARVTGRARSRTAGVLAVSLAVVVAVLLITTTAHAAPTDTSVPNPVPVSPVTPCPPGSTTPACAVPTVTGTPPTSPITLPTPTGIPATSPGTPCSGLDCLPTPTTTTPAPTNSSTGSTGTECSIWDPSTWGNCVNNVLTGFFRTVVSSALNPLLDLLGKTLLTTPTLDSLPRLGELWAGSWHIVLISYALVVLLGGVVVMAYETLHTRYTIKEIAPRLVVGFVAGALSLAAATTGIEIANALSQTLMSGGVDTNTAAETMKALYLNGLTNQGIFELILELAFIVALVAVLVTYVVRVSLTLILIAGAPIMLMGHGLPQTEGIAVTWWKAFGGCLAIQVAQSATLIVALRVLLAPGFTFLVPNSNGLVDLLAGLALLYILFKIPFWILGSIRGQGRSFVGSLLRGFLAYKTFGLMRGLGGGGRGRQRSRPQRPTGPPDPYAKPTKTRTGQYVLPFTGLARGKLPKPSHQRYPARSATRLGPPRPPTGVQLALPLGDDWPENKPVLGRDGQYRLPLPVHRVPPSTSSPVHAPPAPRRRPMGRQLKLPFDPYKNNRPTASGQYPLPFTDARRIPRPAPPPVRTASTPPVSRPRRARVVQPELPFDPYQGNRPMRSGQYPIPFTGLHRQPAPQPRPPVPPPSAPARQRARQLALPLNLPKLRPPRPTTPPARPTNPSGGK